MTKQKVDLSIVIVNWNTCDLLSRCLESVAENVGTCKSLRVETFVVDNASSDGSVKMLYKNFPWVDCIVNAENVGFARANNQAIQESTGRYILLLNSDTVVLSDTFERLIGYMELDPTIGIIGPKLINVDHSFQASHGQFPTVFSGFVNLLGLSNYVYGCHYPSFGPAKEPGASLQLVEWVGGACMLVSRSAIDDVGSLDEHFVMYAEEMDWCFRMHQHNWKVVYCPDVEVIHIGGGSSQQVKEYILARQWASLLRFFEKHQGSLVRIYMRFMLLLLGSLRVIVWLCLAIIQPRKRAQCYSQARANMNLALLNTNYEIVP